MTFEKYVELIKHFDMGIFDIEENIENVKPSREVKFRKIFEEMRDGSQMVVRDTFEIGDRKISMVCIERTLLKVGIHI